MSETFNLMCQQIGYEPKTTFWMDFTIAETFGVAAVEDTYRRAFKEWRENVEFLTELVLVLNWKLWQHYEVGDKAMAQLYNDLWEEADEYAYKTLKEDELTYFLQTTD